MGKLITITPEQETYIPVLRKKWEDVFYLNENLDKEEAEKYIGWLYKTYLKKEAPMIMAMKSPLGCQVLISLLKEIKVKNANLGDNLSANLRANLRDNLRDNLGDKHEPSSYWGNIGDYGWVSFYDFIQKTGHFSTYNFKDFDNYKKLLETGIYELYVFDGLCVICEMPKVFQNTDKQLHNVNGPAAQWRDGWGQYFVNGRSVEKDLIEKGFSKHDLIREENEDKKAAMIMIVKERDGDKGLLNFLEAVIVDEKKILHFEGYEETVRLYKTKEIYDILQDRHGNMGQPYCWSEIICPSTNSTYLIENSADFTDAEEALKFLRPSFIPSDLLYKWEAFAN